MQPTLTLDAMSQIAPAVIAQAPYETVSYRYVFIPTSSLLGALVAEGWRPVAVRNARRHTSKIYRVCFHAVTLVHPDIRIPGAEWMELRIVLTNAHDGSAHASLTMSFSYAGKDLVVGSLRDGLESFVVKHIGGNPRESSDLVRTAVARIATAGPKLSALIAQMKAYTPTAEQRAHLAQKALALRYLGRPASSRPTIASSSLLQPVNAGDTGVDLWSVFLRLQENLERGGLRAPERSRVTRPIRALVLLHEFRRSLWTAAESLMAPAASAPVTSSPGPATDSEGGVSLDLIAA